MLLARETSTLTYENIGVPEQHHSCSHHLNNPKLIARKAKIDQYHVQLLGYFLKRLRDTPDGDGSLLDHSMILYGGGLGKRQSPRFISTCRVCLREGRRVS